MTMTKLLQEIENNKRTRLSMIASLLKRKMMTNIKIVSEVGYLLVDVLRFWHSTVDCASFGLLPEVSLLVSVLAPFWLLALGICGLHWWWRWLVLLGCSFCYLLLFLDGDMAHPYSMALVLTTE
jgi:hypothetical protein